MQPSAPRRGSRRTAENRGGSSSSSVADFLSRSAANLATAMIASGPVGLTDSNLARSGSMKRRNSKEEAEAAMAAVAAAAAAARSSKYDGGGGSSSGEWQQQSMETDESPSLAAVLVDESSTHSGSVYGDEPVEDAAEQQQHHHQQHHHQQQLDEDPIIAPSAAALETEAEGCRSIDVADVRAEVELLFDDEATEGTVSLSDADFARIEAAREAANADDEDESGLTSAIVVPADNPP